MLKKIVAGVAAAVAFVALVAAPSFAGTFGTLETLNPSGGTSASNGIKIDYAAGNVQVTRNTFQQVYPAQSDVDDNPGGYCATGVLPDPDTQGCVSSAFAIAMTSDGNYPWMGTIVIGAPVFPTNDMPALPYDRYWDTITSESTVAADGSGTIHSVMTYSFDWCDDTCAGTLTLDVVLSYTYPNQYYTVDTTTSWVNTAGNSASNDWFARLYYLEDATLSGLDDGNQFSMDDAAGNKLVGVIRDDKTALEGVRTYPNNPVNTFAGLYFCPLTSGDADCDAAVGSSGWIANNQNLPNAIDTTDAIDNGFAVQAGDSSFWLTNVATTAATSKFDLLFMACEPTAATPAECIDAGGYVPPADLPNTGIDTTSMSILGAGALALVGVGVALTVIRRRRNA